MCKWDIENHLKGLYSLDIFAHNIEIKDISIFDNFESWVSIDQPR